VAGLGGDAMMSQGDAAGRGPAQGLMVPAQQHEDPWGGDMSDSCSQVGTLCFDTLYCSLWVIAGTALGRGRRKSQAVV
jgi:hypothetical protein